MDAYQQILQGEIAEANELHDAMLEYCRLKSEALSEYVMRDDKGVSFTNAPHHNRLHLAVRQVSGQVPGIVIRWPPEYGKTQQLISLILHILGRNSDERYKDPHPMYRGAYISSSLNSAKKRLRTIKDYIETSPELHEVFPNLKKATGQQEVWTNEAINVTRPDNIRLDDPSVQAVGEGGDLLGSRLDWAIMDDTLTFKNTRTKEQRQNHWDWIKSTVQTRMNEWGIIIMLCNSWHPEDAAYRLVNEAGWALLEECALDKDGESIWKERFSTERVKNIIINLGPIEGPRKMMHRSRDEATMRFSPAMINVALERGRGMSLCSSYIPTDGTKVYTGVDFASSKRKNRTAGRSTGETVLFTWARLRSGVRIVLNIQSGRWSGTEIVRRAKDVSIRFNSLLVMEDNSAQALVIDVMKSLDITLPIVTHTTTEKDYDPQYGLELMGVEMQNGAIIIPCENPALPTGEVFTWIQELYDYVPGKHPGDRLMASYFAWDRLRRMERVSGASNLKLIRG